jgi:hypothetical protein
MHFHTFCIGNAVRRIFDKSASPKSFAFLANLDTSLMALISVCDRNVNNFARIVFGAILISISLLVHSFAGLFIKHVQY